MTASEIAELEKKGTLQSAIAEDAAKHAAKMAAANPTNGDSQENTHNESDS